MMNQTNAIFNNEKELQEALKIYYGHLFPYALICEWLSYGSSSYLHKREIAFILLKEVYLRYRAFKSEDDFRSYLLQMSPLKLDIGAVYDKSPGDRLFFTNFKAIERELVFDIDMTDYDSIRTCCKEANVCNKCWKFISIACKILDRLLREDFGFDHILWVYSGRRGVHCWVCDEVARKLSDEERACIVSYINIVEGGSFVQRRVNLIGKPSYPIQRALDIINGNFIDFIIKDQNVLGTEEGLIHFLNLLWDGPKDDFEKIMSACETSLDRWLSFDLHLNFLRENNLVPDKWMYLKEAIILHFVYPRLDLAVTKRRDHLLKGPFCIHPKTGKICVTFNPKEVEHFNVDQVPTIQLVLQELNDYYKGMGHRSQENKPPVLDNIRKTSMCESVNVFIAFLNELKKCQSNRLQNIV